VTATASMSKACGARTARTTFQYQTIKTTARQFVVMTMTNDKDDAGLYHDDPDKQLTVVAYDAEGSDPWPLFVVETQDDGIEAARELVEEHGGSARWTTIPLQRVTSYDDVTDLLPEPEGDAIDAD